ncbi:MAG: hypothetical protein M0R76_09460 [Proteobacteria bacterium]|nr:hypothetical protein [Pseudomonadota bacterium]
MKPNSAPTLLMFSAMFWLWACGGTPTATPHSAADADATPQSAPLPPPEPTVSFCGQSLPLHTDTVVCNREDVSDIAPLAELPSLTRLVLNHTRVTDVSPLAARNTLRDLVITGCDTRAVDGLETLTDLRSLSLVHTEVSDLSFVASLTQLEELLLHNTPAADLSPLAALAELRVLSIGASVKKITALLGLKHLEELVVMEAKVPQNQLTRLKKALPNLRIIK